MDTYAEAYGWRVGKRDLVGATQVVLQNGRLKIAGGLVLAATLKKELLNFRIKVDQRSAYDSYEHWQEDDHDDLVLAAAMACWFRERYNGLVDQANRTVDSAFGTIAPTMQITTSRDY